jgi:large subunit ribosomal protein L21
MGKMFAIFKSGGKQYKVQADNIIKLEKLSGAPGSKIEFNEILLIGGEQSIVGSPFVQGASITAEIVKQARDPKVIVFKKKRRQNYRRKNGHRQDVTHVLIKEIRKA